MGVLGDVISGVLGGINTGYNIWTNKRDFDYQKALQQEMFEREDTAVKRKVEDLKSAGLNPALANGSGAGAGSVVARSNTNDVNFGSALDLISAANQIKQQKQQTENAKKEGMILDEKLEQEYNNSQLSFANTLAQLGIGYQTVSYGGEIGGKPGFKVKLNPGFETSFDNYINRTIDYQNSYNKNAADIMAKNNAWYVADKALGVVGDMLPYINLYKKIK